VTLPRPPRCGVLLAGGAGMRFGAALKGLLPLGDARVADGAVRALMAVCDEVVVAANDAAAGDWFPGHRVVRDREAGLGALKALDTALHAANGRNVVVCAWDMPFVTAAVLTALIEIVELGAPCCVPVHADGLLEPLCAAYAPICAPVVTGLMVSGERAAHAIIDAVGGSRWAIDQELSPDAAARTFFNVNTPDDLRRAESWVLPQLIRST
jgi:molybdenum cofactor guanylyltransferase